jgi:hypothetical protein
VNKDKGEDYDRFQPCFYRQRNTLWSGLVLLKQLGERLGFLGQLSEIGLPEFGSNMGYQPEQLNRSVIDECLVWSHAM